MKKNILAIDRMELLIFTSFQLDVVFEKHSLFVEGQPHLFQKQLLTEALREASS